MSIITRTRLTAITTLAAGGALSLAVMPTAQAAHAAALTNPRLQAVGLLSPTDGWGVGYSDNATTGVQPLITRWNGTAFSAVASPNPGTSSELNAVSADSATDAWAVGRNFPTGSHVQANLMLHWNGKSWTQVPSPSPGTLANVVNGVKTLSPSNAWAVGSYTNNGPGNTEQLANLILHWDGKTWTKVPTPALNGSELTSIAATSATDAWAVGFSNADGVATTLILHWDGTSWKRVASADPGPNGNWLQGVSALSATDAWAVGRVLTGAKAEQTITLHWDGTSWKRVASPNPGGTAGSPQLNAVNADSANDAWAVGQFWLNGKLVPLTEHWNGTTWTKFGGPGGSADYDSLQSVAVTSPTSAVAVGRGSYNSLILQWNGTSWTKLPSPS